MSDVHTILLVESPSSARNALAELLGDEGFEVVTADDNDDGLATARAIAPSVVIADLELPCQGSFVQRVVALPHAPTVIAVTEYGRIAPALTALRDGAADYLIKPIRGDELLVVLDKAIEHHEQALELELLRAELGRSARSLH
jgi:two-component system response regulator PilR (NtrC family)